MVTDTAAIKKPRKVRTIKAAAAAKKANRRQRDTPTTARVDASRLNSDGVLVVCVDDVLTKNERHRLVLINIGRDKSGRPKFRAGTKEGELAEAFKSAVRSAAEAAGFILGARTIASAVWSLEVVSVWPSERHLDSLPMSIANGDSDSALPMMRDAMQCAGLIDDDMRIISNSARSHYEKGQRRTVAILTRISPAAHDAEVKRILAVEAATLAC